MSRIQDIQQQANTLTNSEKALLAVGLLDSLPPVLDEVDDGLGEALRRDDELERNPNLGITWEELRSSVGR